MSILMECDAGVFVVDLYEDLSPVACFNFEKLCEIGYYNDCLIFNIQKNFIIQTGDPTGTGQGGESIFGIVRQSNTNERGHFLDEIETKRNLFHVKRGLVAMANTGANTNASQFLISLRKEDMESLAGRHSIFGEVVEGMDVIDEISRTFVDAKCRPYIDIRIRRTIVLVPTMETQLHVQMRIESSSLLESFGNNRIKNKSKRPVEETNIEQRISWSKAKALMNGSIEQNEEAAIAQRELIEAENRALKLTLLGDLPSADVKPEENILFVCKLNAATRDADLQMIFSRFGEVTNCEIIRDKKTGDSLQYAFVEFATREQCEEAYKKMNDVLIDDRRIKVDFSQSVATIWKRDGNTAPHSSRTEIGVVRNNESSIQQERADRTRSRNRSQGNRRTHHRHHGRRNRSRSRPRRGYS